MFRLTAMRQNEVIQEVEAMRDTGQPTAEDAYALFDDLFDMNDRTDQAQADFAASLDTAIWACT